jgi:phage protein
MNKQVLDLVEKLDEHEDGHADEAPRYVKNILARSRELPLHDREVWLKTIMGEFEQDFSRAKWREGYEQGKVEGLIEREKVIVPQFVADWIEYCKITHVDLQHALIVGDVYFYNYANQKDFSKLKEFLETENNQETFARVWLDGYEVEKEKQYTVRLKNTDDYLVKTNNDDYRFYNNIYTNRRKHTRKELEQAGFGWVFDCPGVEVEEVEG